MTKYMLLKDCRQLLAVTSQAKDLIGLSENTSLLIKDERIEALGNYFELKKLCGSAPIAEIDCSEYIVMPGFIDSHTHLVFGESRVDEYAASLILDSSGVRKAVTRFGLAASIYSTKKASEEELIESSLLKLRRMLKSGTTTVEIKSGYGIDKETELKQLRVIRRLKAKVPQTILATYLGAHYYDMEMGKEKYIDFMINEVMPDIEKEQLADFCDIWVDNGYYTAAEADRILSAGSRHGMRPSLHSECYSDIGGAKIAVKLKAANVGHLNYLSIADAGLLAAADVTGIVIPGTDFSVKHPKPFEPRPMLDAGMTLAIATNLNPGNWIESMKVAMALGCRNHGMSVEEAIRASTLGGAKALGIAGEYGSLEPGKFADIQILSSDSYKNCVYKFDVDEVEMVIKKGRIVVGQKEITHKRRQDGL